MATAQFVSMGVTPNVMKSELDMDNFFDFNQSTSFNSPRPSSTIQHRAGPSRPTPTFFQDPSFDDGEDKQIFAGPSHEYDRFKQQTGVHIGDLSHLNQPMPTSFNQNQNQNQGQNQMYGGFNSGIDEMSMGAWSTGLDMDADMTMDFGSSVPTICYPTSQSLMEPSHTEGAEEPQSSVGRLWPGMHQQQAQQQAIARAQQQNQQQQQHQFKGKGRATSQQNDPHTEESISRLLNRMRQGSTVSTIAEDDSSVQDGFMPNIARMKKEEEDMDEDERLLASEEGKRLSSKERRQLRNKVSARAFRSRRKEYIGQLEGDLALKANECGQLKADNTKLSEENSRYKDLIQFLLRQPSFAPVLEDISKDPSLVQFAAQQQQPSHTSAPKVRAHQAHSAHPQQRQAPDHVGMALMPEPSVDLSMLNLQQQGYNMPQGMNFNFR